MAYERIHTSLSKGIETITLDYGPTLNALDMVMAGELAEALEEAEGNPEVKVLVLAGAGRAFSAGGAVNLAFACDFIFAADNAKFLQAFVGIGLCPDTGGVYFLPRMVGSHRAFDMFVTGRPVSAKEALEIGLVKEVTTKEDLMPTVMAFAEKLTEGPLLAYGNMKKLMFASLYKGFEDYMKDEAVYLAQCSGSEDFKEGITAFLEKRKAEFKGK